MHFELLPVRNLETRTKCLTAVGVLVFNYIAMCMCASTHTYICIYISEKQKCKPSLTSEEQLKAVFYGFLPSVNV